MLAVDIGGATTDVFTGTWAGPPLWMAPRNSGRGWCARRRWCRWPLLRPGARVRLLRAPDAGHLGVVVRLPPLPCAVASEAVVRVALVALDGGGLRTVPRRKLEVEG